MDEKPLIVEQSGGHSLIENAPIFSHDGKLIFCTCGSEVNVFSAETGECVQRLIGHDDEITGIAIHPALKVQAITSSLDGTIRTWDYEDGILLKTCKVGRPLSRVFTCQGNKAHILLVTKEPDVGNLLRMPVEKISVEDVTDDPELLTVATGITRKMAKCVGFLHNGKYAAYCIGNKICVHDLMNKNHYAEHENLREGKITSLACHPTENCFATGHSAGIIKFWRNVCPKKGKTPKPIVSHVHWHHSFVQDMAFTPGGSSLMSIGAECVLVQWHYQQQGNKKNLLPGLGGEARHVAVSPDSTLYLVTLRHNAALIITNNFEIKHTIEGFTAVRSHIPKGKVKMLEYDWKTRSCVTPGKLGHLLFYKPHSDIQLYNLDITHKNYLHGDPGSKRQQSIITHVAFSQESKIGESKEDPMNCTWMATVEEISHRPIVQDRKLKFWVYDETEQWWKLNTVINDPHKSTVTRITFRPSLDSIPALLTTGLDGVAKIWEVKDSDETSKVFWNCCSVAAYRKLEAKDGDFSQDGSLVAVAFGHAICMSELDNFHNIPLLFSFARDEIVKRVLFGRHSCQHMLLMALESSLKSFDLLSGNVSWTVDLKIDHFVRDPLSDNMAAISQSNDLYVFKPSSCIPVYKQKEISNKNILSSAFVPNVKGQNNWLGNGSEVPWMRTSRYFFVDRRMSVYTLCTAAEIERKRKMSSVAGSLARNLESLQTPLASVLQKSVAEDDPKPEGQTIKELSRHAQLAALRKITDTPCHILPPITALCDEFVMSLIPKRVQKQTEPHENKDNDVAMDVNDCKTADEPKTTGISELEKRLAEVDFSTIENANYHDFFEGLWE